MTYATVQDMIDRFGETEIIRLSRPEDRAAETVDQARVEKMLGDATAVAEGYLRGRYRLPIAAPPVDLVRAVCILARFDLAQSGRSKPSDQMTKDHEKVIAWLGQVSKDVVRIDAPRLGNDSDPAGASGLRTSDRDAIFTPESLSGL